jgi:hypothetical protein
LYRQVSGLLALENAIDVGGRPVILVDKVRPIRDQAAVRDERALIVDRRQLVASCECDN